MRTSRGEGGFTALEVLVGVAILSIVSAIALPLMGNMMGHLRLSGDARGVSDSIAVAKMRAASTFSKARLYVDLGANSYRVEALTKTGVPAWTTDEPATLLAYGDSFSFGAVGSAPPNTQATIALAPACLDINGATIANTACVVFNSRGIPIDATGAATSIDAVYLTDSLAVYGVTIAATGLSQLWRTGPAAAATWATQ